MASHAEDDHGEGNGELLPEDQPELSGAKEVPAVAQPTGEALGVHSAKAAGIDTGGPEQPALRQEKDEEQQLTGVGAPEAAAGAEVAPSEEDAKHGAPGSELHCCTARDDLGGTAGGSGKQALGSGTPAEPDEDDSHVVDGGLQHTDTAAAAAAAEQLDVETDAGAAGDQQDPGAVEAPGGQPSLGEANAGAAVYEQPAQDAEGVLLLEVEEDRGREAGSCGMGQQGQQAGEEGDGETLEAVEERQRVVEQGSPAGDVEGGVSAGELVARADAEVEAGALEEEEEGGEGAGVPAEGEQHWGQQRSEEAAGAVAAGEGQEAEQEHTEDVGEEEVSYGDGDEAADSAAAAAAAAPGGSGEEEAEGPVAAAGAPAEGPATEGAAAAAAGGGALEQRQGDDRSATAPAEARTDAAGTTDHTSAGGKERRGKRASPRSDAGHQRRDGEATAFAGQGPSIKRGREAAPVEGGKKAERESKEGRAAGAGGRGQDAGSFQPSAAAGGGKGRAKEGEGGSGKEGDAGGRKGEGRVERRGGGVARPDEKGQEQTERPREHGSRRDPREEAKDRGGPVRQGPSDKVPALRVTARPGGERRATAAASPRNRPTHPHGGSARDQPQEHRSGHHAAYSPRGPGRQQQHSRDGGETASLLPPHLRPQGSSQPRGPRGDLTSRQADRFAAAAPDRCDHSYDHGYDRYQPAPDPYSQPAAPTEREGHTRYVTQGLDGRAPRYSTTGAAAAAPYEAPRAGRFDPARSRPAYSPPRDSRRSMDSRGGSVGERGARYGEGARGVPGYPQQAQRGAPLYSKRRELSSSPDPPPYPKRVAAVPYADPYYDPPQRPQQGYSDGGYPPRYDAGPAAAAYPHTRSEAPPLDGRYRPAAAAGGRSRSPPLRRHGEYAAAGPPLEALPLRGGAGGGYFDPRDSRGPGAGYPHRSAVSASGQAPRIVDERGLIPESPRGGAYARPGAGAGGYPSPRQPRHAPVAAGSGGAPGGAPGGGGGSYIPPGYGPSRQERSYSPPLRGPPGPAGRFGGGGSAAEPMPPVRSAADRYGREPAGHRYEPPPTGERYGTAAGGGRAAAAGGGGGGRRYEDPPRDRAPPPRYDERGYELMPRGPPEGGYARRGMSPEPRGPYDSRGAPDGMAPLSREGGTGSRPGRADYQPPRGDYRPRGPPDVEYERTGDRGGPRPQQQQQQGAPLRTSREGYAGPSAGGSGGYDDRRLPDRGPAAGAEGRGYDGYRGGPLPPGRDPYRDGGGNGGRGPPGPDRGDRPPGRGLDDERFARGPRYGDSLPPPHYRDDDLPPHAHRYAAGPAALGSPLDAVPAGLGPSPPGAPLSPHLLAPPGMLSAAPTVLLQHAAAPAGALLPAGTLQGVPLQQTQQQAVFGQVAAAPLVLPAAGAAGVISGAGLAPMVSVAAGGLGGGPRGAMARPAVDEEPIWFYTDPQGQKHGPHSISQFRRWLEGLAERPDLNAEYQAFKSITVFRSDRPQGVPLMMLLK